MFKEKPHNPLSDDRLVLSPHRRSGNTTRICNLIIEMIFEGKRVQIVDHYRDSRRSGDNYLYDKLMGRLKREHMMQKFDIERDGDGYKVISLIIEDNGRTNKEVNTTT